MSKQKDRMNHKREVVAVMFEGADRTGIVTERMRSLYDKGRSGTQSGQEGQMETASPEREAAETLQEEMECVPQKSIHTVRQVNRTAERIKRVKEIKGTASHVPTARTAGTSKTVPAGGKATVVGAGKSPAKAAKKVKELAVSAAKAVYQGIKSGWALLAAAGSVAVLVILLICMVGMILGSTFGIFFTGTEGTGERTIRTVMYELDAEYEQMISGIQSSHEHDILEMHGKRPEWKDVLAIYAVKTNLDSNDPEELITMTAQKERKLRDIYWDMCSVSSNMGTEWRIVTITVVGKDGKEKEKKVLREVTVLTIRTDSATADQMAGRYFFDWEQRELLDELMDSGNDPFWAAIIP
ncbi:MAG: hypothetical protein IJA58_00175 [Lachnospiraceae bacterium]|nr:hypothetical protein [Lachnospiraceae bacterium]